jgi:erythromycin esterase-like protein
MRSSSRPVIGWHGFNIIAVEADWPDAARIDRYVRHHAHEPSSEEAFSRPGLDVAQC